MDDSALMLNERERDLVGMGLALLEFVYPHDQDPIRRLAERSLGIGRASDLRRISAEYMQQYFDSNK